MPVRNKKPQTYNGFLRSLGTRQRGVVTCLMQGGVLMRFFENEREVYHLEGLGEVSPDTIRRLKARNLLAEKSDAMFGVGMSFHLQNIPGMDHA